MAMIGGSGFLGNDGLGDMDFEEYYRKHRKVKADCSRLSQTLMLDCIERNDPHDQWCESCLDYERCSSDYDSHRNDDMR